jgi:hypothetical protein
MAVGWETLKALPLTELHRLSDAQIAAHLSGDRGEAEAA